MKKSILIALACAAVLAGRAQATVVSTATPNYLGAQFIAAPSRVHRLLP